MCIRQPPRRTFMPTAWRIPIPDKASHAHGDAGAPQKHSDAMDKNHDGTCCGLFCITAIAHEPPSALSAPSAAQDVPPARRRPLRPRSRPHQSTSHRLTQRCLARAARRMPRARASLVRLGRFHVRAISGSMRPHLRGGALRIGFIRHPRARLLWRRCCGCAARRPRRSAARIRPIPTRRARPAAYRTGDRPVCEPAPARSFRLAPEQ